LINTSRQVGGPIGLALLLRITNFGTLAPTGHKLALSAAAVMATGFGYAFLAAALLTMIGIIFTALLVQERHRQAGAMVSATVHQS
jgi:hypothetical protein